MEDVVIERQTYISVADDENMLFPAEDIYPSLDLYPAEAEKVENIVQGTMNISEILCESNIAFGQLYSTKFEVQVYETEDLSGKYIIVVQEENGVYNYVFSGIIDSCKQDRLGYDRTIVAYDKAYSTSRINVASWWTSFWETNETATVKQFRESLLNFAKISYENVTLPNDSIVLKKTCNINSIAFSTMLKMVCEISCCFPHFNRAGIMQFIVLNKENGKAIVDEDFEGENSTFEEYTTDAITGIQFYTSSGNIVYTVGTTTNPYSITDNVLIYGMEVSDYEIIGQTMLSHASQLTYKPSNVQMVVGNFNYEVGDYILTSKGNFFLFQNTYSGSQFVEQTLAASGSQKSEEVGTDINTDEVVAESMIDEVEGTLDDIYEISEDEDDELAELYENVEGAIATIEKGDDYILMRVAGSTGKDQWDTTGYYFDENNSGYEEPKAERITSPIWSNQGYAISEEVDSKPSVKDYDDTIPYRLYDTNGDLINEETNDDVNIYIKRADNGRIFQYKIYIDGASATRATVNAPATHIINNIGRKLMRVVSDGRRLNFTLLVPYNIIMEAHDDEYIENYRLALMQNINVTFNIHRVVDKGKLAGSDYYWEYTPNNITAGSYYLDCESGKIWRRNTSGGLNAWTFIKQCDPISEQLETSIELTKEAITAEATSRIEADENNYNTLNSKIEITAQGIRSDVAATYATKGSVSSIESSIEQLPHTISMSVTNNGVLGANSSAGITISLYDENGRLVDNSNQGTITLDGNVVFKSNLTDGTTSISGENIKTGTIDADRINLNTVASKTTNPVIFPDSSGIQIGPSESNTFIRNNQIKTKYLYGDVLSNQSQGTLYLWAINESAIEGELNCYGNNIVINGKNNISAKVSATEKMRIDNDKVDIKSPIYYSAFPDITASTGTPNIRCQNPGSASYRFAPTSASSERWKHDIRPLEDENINAHKLYDLDVDQFVYNLDYVDTSDTRYDTPIPGFIAEKVAIAYPIACERDNFGQPQDWNVRYIVPPMLALIQEQNERIKALENILKTQGGN